MEIERKFIADPSGHLTPEDYPSVNISQGYLFTDPVIRIRKADEAYILTIKSGGLLAHQEFELPLTKDQFEKLSRSVQGTFLEKTRYMIPCGPYTIELDIFHGKLNGLIYAEVEFPSIEEAKAFLPPAWFIREVTEDGSFSNASLSRMTDDERKAFLAGL